LSHSFSAAWYQRFSGSFDPPARSGQNILSARLPKLFKTDTFFEDAHTLYRQMGNMLPTVAPVVGTRVISVAGDAPASGTITEEVPVLREVSLPMHPDESSPG
jgi:hypothetical protein